MPTPIDQETEEEFIARCMSDDEAQETFPNDEQRLAFCYSVWTEEEEKYNYRGTEIDLVPSKEMAEEAKKGLEWRKEYNRGGTPVGVARARDISNRKELSPSTVRRMLSYFARHTVDKDAEGFRPGEKGYPSAGRIAWALWGGDSGERWAKSKDKQLSRIEDEKLLIPDLNNWDNKAMEKKLIKFDSCEFKSMDAGIFEGYASVFNGLDSYNDTVLPGAYKNTLENRKDVAMLFNHSSFRSDMPSRIGKWLSMSEDDKGLYVRGQLALGHPTADAVYASMKWGTIDGLSIGYAAKQFDMVDNVRNLKEIDLYEVSVVDFPADGAARVSLDSVKSEIEALKSIRDAEKFLREAGNFSLQSAKTLLARIKSLAREEIKDEIEKAEYIKRFQTFIKG